MTDSLGSVNAMNAKSKQIQVRLVNVKARHATSTLSVFGVHVVTSTGHCVWAENLLFDDEASRKKQLDSLRKKMTPGSTWIFSNMTVKK